MDRSSLARNKGTSPVKLRKADSNSILIPEASFRPSYVHSKYLLQLLISQFFLVFRENATIRYVKAVVTPTPLLALNKDLSQP